MLAIDVHRNPKNDDIRDPLEEFLNRFKEIENTKHETNNGDNITNYEDLDKFEFDEEKNSNTNDDWNARFYNDNRKYGVVDDKEPKSNSNHCTASTSSDATSVA